MLTPSPQIARSTGVMLCLGIALTDVAGIQQLFALEAYLGVGLILAIGIAVSIAAMLLVQDGDGVWTLALVIGSLNVLGVLASRMPGLPLLKSAEVASSWFRSTTLTLGADALLLVALACWVLVARHHRPAPPDAPVTSASERASHLVERHQVPEPRRQHIS